ncbi:diflavin oxidoreductase [Methyloceanibacter marginalis]|uniref:diflavin oxidoreductase n=1 Tax=Methyloceanibacter marginalis TaxID=1774971 RepID=UPI000B0C309C
MTAFDFHGPGLTEEQWQRIKELASNLNAEQALWLSGYFAGVDHRLREIALTGEANRPNERDFQIAASETTSRTITILFGSETGNSGEMASALGDALRKEGLTGAVIDMANYKTRQLKNERDVLIITSTHGEGDPPATALDFFEYVEGNKAPSLEGIRYAVLALGDSTYEQYCEAGKRLDQRLAVLGAERLFDRVDCDVDFEDAAAEWIKTVTEKLKKTRDGQQFGGRAADAAPQSKPSAAIIDQRHPFQASIIENIVLTGRGSSKETRHIEMSVEGSDLRFEPGDALGIIPRNDPRLVDALLETLHLSADAEVSVRDKAVGLGQALTEDYEITVGTTRFINQWADLTGAEELIALRGNEQAEARSEFLLRNHIIDIVRRYPGDGVEPEASLADFVPCVRGSIPLPRAVLCPDEVHLTVATVRFDLHGEARSGVATGYLADQCAPSSMVSVYIQPNPRFRLPADDAPILMIGAGTGVAPYRAFLQEREARGASGRSWLVFGDRNFHTDFLYQTEWQQWLKDGILTRMQVAFSRDEEKKYYVQHRLAENARDVYAWFEEGASLYVCGGRELAPAIHTTLIDILKQEGGYSDVSAAEYLGEMQSHRRYQVDVY